LTSYPTISAVRACAILSLSTLLEALRSRLVWVSIIFSIILVAASVAGASVALYEQARLIVDVGLAATSIVGTVVATAATLIFFANEITNHTAYVTLARPIARWTLVVGKFFGLWAALGLCVAIMGLSTAAVVFVFDGALPTAFWGAVWLTGIEMGVVISVALLLATVCAPSLAAAYAAALLLAANMSPDILLFAEHQESPQLKATLTTLFYLLPDLDKLSLRPWAANALPVPDGYVATATLYGVTYAASAVILAMVNFSRRRAL
jgi:Cu-processing system permease protein